MCFSRIFPSFIYFALISILPCNVWSVDHICISVLPIILLLIIFCCKRSNPYDNKFVILWSETLLSYKNSKTVQRETKREVMRETWKSCSLIINHQINKNSKYSRLVLYSVRYLINYSYWPSLLNFPRGRIANTRGKPHECLSPWEKRSAEIYHIRLAKISSSQKILTCVSCENRQTVDLIDSYSYDAEREGGLFSWKTVTQ